MISDNNNGIKDIKGVDIDKNHISSSAKIDIGCCIEGVNDIEDNVSVLHNSVIQNTCIGRNTKIDFSYIEDSVIGSGFGDGGGRQKMYRGFARGVREVGEVVYRQSR